MRHLLHDGPDDNYMIRSGKMRRAPARPTASLSALQWAADRANQSYGQFTQRLTSEDEARIQAEYEEMMRQRAEEQAARAAAREAARAAELQAEEDDEGLIMDEDDL